jgi:hypothetical protein
MLKLQLSGTSLRGYTPENQLRNTLRVRFHRSNDEINTIMEAAYRVIQFNNNHPDLAILPTGPPQPQAVTAAPQPVTAPQQPQAVTAAPQAAPKQVSTDSNWCTPNSDRRITGFRYTRFR